MKTAEITQVPSVEDVENALMALGWKPRRIASRLAKIGKIDQTTWRRWRNGEVEPTLSSWRRVIDAVIKVQKRGKQDGVEALVSAGNRRVGKAHRRGIERRTNR